MSKLPIAIALPVLLALSPALAGERLTVESRPVADLKAVFAAVDSVREAKARTRIGGTLEALSVREGDRVSSGQVLAVVRDPKLSLQLTAADARLNSLEAQRRQAVQELDRARQLRQTGAGTQQKLDDAQTGLDVVVAGIAAMKADRAVIEQQLREGEVLAPAAGRILQVPAVTGAVIQPGETVAVLATDAYVLRLHLPERHARFMHVGDPVLVGARGLGAVETQSEFKTGRVTLVYPELDNGQVVADAEVPELGDYFVGERVRVLVSSGTRDAVVVPEAFLSRLAGVDLVHLAGGPAAPVQRGRMVPALGAEPGGVEILSGLKSGDVIEKAEAAQ